MLVSGPGDLIFKPRNQWHTFWNADDEPARILEIISPAGFEKHFAELVGPAIEERISSRSATSPWSAVWARSGSAKHPEASSTVRLARRRTDLTRYAGTPRDWTQRRDRETTSDQDRGSEVLKVSAPRSNRLPVLMRHDLEIDGSVRSCTAHVASSRDSVTDPSAGWSPRPSRSSSFSFNPRSRQGWSGTDTQTRRAGRPAIGPGLPDVAHPLERLEFPPPSFPGSTSNAASVHAPAWIMDNHLECAPGGPAFVFVRPRIRRCRSSASRTAGAC